MIYSFENFLLDTRRYQINCEGESIAVEPQVFDLLVYLIQHRDRVVKRDELLRNLWPGKVVTDAALSARLKAARRAVGDTGKTQKIIKTIHGRGYQFVAAAGESTPSDPPPQTDLFETPGKPSIAVLPFESLSSEPRGEALSNGLTEDIVNALSRIPTLLVIASYSTRMYKNRPVDIRQVATEQAVRYVLEGSVQLSGDRVRITSQLLDAVTGRNVWGDRYERSLHDLFAVQDEIMRSIVTALQVELTIGSDAQHWGRGTDNVQAWLLVARAADLLNLYTKAALLEARQLAKQALDLEPDLASAWNGLGWSYYEDGVWEWTGDRLDRLDMAMECAQKAFALNGEHRDAYDFSLMGCVHSQRGEYDQAVEKCSAAVAIAPGSHENRMILAGILAFADLPVEALREAKKASRLCPMPPPWSLMFQGVCHYLNNQRQDALELIRKSVEQEPCSAQSRVWLTILLADDGDLDEARRIATALLEIEPDFSCRRWFGVDIGRPILKNPRMLESAIRCLTEAGVPA